MRCEKTIFDGSCSSNRESTVLSDEADLLVDKGFYDEAIDLYMKCLILVQEEGNLLKEAEVNSKIIRVFFKFFII